MRRYRYYFPVSKMDVQKMNRAATLLECTHDFQNVAKLDPSAHVRNVVDENSKGTYGLLEAVEGDSEMNLDPASIPLEEKTMVARIQFKRHINSSKGRSHSRR